MRNLILLIGLAVALTATSVHAADKHPMKLCKYKISSNMDMVMITAANFF